MVPGLPRSARAPAWETTSGNRKEADRLLAQRLQEIGRGTYATAREQVTFDELAESFLKHCEGQVRDTTLKDYTGNCVRHLAPFFWGWKLRAIQRATVEALRARLLDKGVGARTVNKCLTLLGQMCRYAIRHGWLETNPAEGTKLRLGSRRSHDLVESPAEIAALLAASEDRWRVIILAAVLTGLREGELLGLSWGISTGIPVRSTCGARTARGASMSRRRQAHGVRWTCRGSWWLS